MNEEGVEILDIPIIDDHCHPFLPEKETKKELPSFFTISFVPEVRVNDIENTILYKRVVKELGRILGVKDDKDLAEKRFKEYHSNPRKYIRKLFMDAKIEMLIIDVGYPSEEYTGYSISMDDFQKLVPYRIKRIFRIEPLIYKLFIKNIPPNPKPKTQNEKFNITT